MAVAVAGAGAEAAGPVAQTARRSSSDDSVILINDTNMCADRPNVVDTNREWECPSCTFVNNYRYSVYKKNCFMCGKEEDEDKEEDEEEEEEDSSEQRGLPATRKPLNVEDQNKLVACSYEEGVGYKMLKVYSKNCPNPQGLRMVIANEARAAGGVEDDEEGDEGEGREEEKHSERRVHTAKRRAEYEDEDEEEEKKGPPSKCRALMPLPYSSSAASVRGLQDKSLVTQLQESRSRAWGQVGEYKEQLAQSREDIKALREDLKEQRDENKALRGKAQQLAAVLKTAQASVAVTPSNAAAAAAAMDIAVGGDDLLH